MEINAILARDQNNVIGNGLSLPWAKDDSTKWDMAHFKRLTTGNIVYMGWNTYLSLPKALPDRINVVESTRLSSPRLKESFIQAQSLQDFINTLSPTDIPDKLFIIGGAKTLKKYAAQIEKLYLTTFFTTYKGDITFDSGFLSAFSKKTTLEEHSSGIIELYSR